MNYHFQDLIPAHFAEDSRVWIYQSNRQFSIDETILVKELLESFASSWLSHGARVSGFANLFFGQFLIFIADETATGVSGCSTDSSVRLVKNIEQDHCVQLFNRQNLAFIVNERIQVVPLDLLNSAIGTGMISPETLYFNNTVLSLKDLKNDWIIPARQSWLANKFPLLNSVGV